MMELEKIVKVFTLSIGSLVEGVAALIIAYAALRAVVHYVKNSIVPDSQPDKLEIRLSLGKALALALEFLLAADIVRTAVAPTWNDIGKLAAIAVLRTLLNYFLDRELKHSESKVVPA